MSAIRSSNMAWISAKSWRRSRLASTPTFTTSRPSAGKVSAKRRNSDRLPLPSRKSRTTVSISIFAFLELEHHAEQFLGLPTRERARRRSQPHHHPSRGRFVQFGSRSGGPQHQGRDGHSAPVRSIAVRRRPRSALQDTDRCRKQSERRRG